MINKETVIQEIEKENKNLTFEEILIVEIIKKVNNPFANLTVKNIAKDLNIGINTAYEIFKRDDFPSIDIGKTKTITLLAYLIWKLQKHK